MTIVIKNFNKFFYFTLKNHVIVLNGESGSGKSETCKYLMEYFTNIKCNNDSFKLKLLQSLRILEAFGNSSNGINSNSTRLAKYFELNFSTDGYLHSGMLRLLIILKKYYFNYFSF